MPVPILFLQVLSPDATASSRSLCARAPWPLCRPVEGTVDGLDIFWNQFDPMFCEIDPTQMSIQYPSEFTEHCQDIFAITRVFIRPINLIFAVMCQPFAVRLLYRMVSFHLGVPVYGLFIVDFRDDVLSIFQVSAGMSLLFHSSQSIRLISVMAVVSCGLVDHTIIVCFSTWNSFFGTFYTRMYNGRPGLTSTARVAVNCPRIVQIGIGSTMLMPER